jgi:hypothetical protein
MFSDPCDGDSSERVAASTAIAEYVGALVRRAFPGADLDALSPAIWAVVHGLAFLYLDGKLDTSTAQAGRRPGACGRSCPDRRVHSNLMPTDYLTNRTPEWSGMTRVRSMPVRITLQLLVIGRLPR